MKTHNKFKTAKPHQYDGDKFISVYNPDSRYFVSVRYVGPTNKAKAVAKVIRDALNKFQETDK